MTITDAEIETVARRFCVEIGLDPDDTTETHGWTHNRWHAYATQARDAIAMHRALRAIPHPPPPEWGGAAVASSGTQRPPSGTAYGNTV